MNSNMNYGQTIPGIREGLGRGEVFRYLFVLEMLDGVELLKGQKYFMKMTKKQLKNGDLCNWLQTSSVASEEQLAKTIMVLHLMFTLRHFYRIGTR
jgi:hypothetical protein